MFKITVQYDGKYPNLCRGKLIVMIEDKAWVFPDYCLSSKGSVRLDEDGYYSTNKGDWIINEWPEDFPELLKDDVTNAVNENIRHGCCGGCA